MISALVKLINGFFMSLGVVGIFLMIAFWLACPIGWVMNLWKFVWLALSTTVADHLVELILRGVGLPFAPLGVIMGLFV